VCSPACWLRLSCFPVIASQVLRTIATGGTLGILLPPSTTMILFAVAAEKSLGRLFLAGIGPALLLVLLVGAYAVMRFRKEYAAAHALYTPARRNVSDV
jgi:TRAP-type C4-dicarboxylate transport system permease large subunit